MKRTKNGDWKDDRPEKKRSARDRLLTLERRGTRVLKYSGADTRGGRP